MGIRCYCPNGHKLNIKSFLAGLTGVCPRCGAKFQVPTQSVRKSSKEEKAEDAIEIVEVDSLAAADQKGVARSGEASRPPISDPQTGAPASSATDDPLAEAPEALWYVRPASGGEFGPASAELMRNWLQEGRVGPNSLVWREGWQSWREATAVFPRWSIPVPQIEIHLPNSPSSPKKGTLSELLQVPRGSRHRSVRFNVTLITVLATLVVVLVIVLIEIMI